MCSIIIMSAPPLGSKGNTIHLKITRAVFRHYFLFNLWPIGHWGRDLVHCPRLGLTYQGRYIYISPSKRNTIWKSFALLFNNLFYSKYGRSALGVERPAVIPSRICCRPKIENITNFEMRFNRLLNLLLRHLDTLDNTYCGRIIQ